MMIPFCNRQQSSNVSFILYKAYFKKAGNIPAFYNMVTFLPSRV
ncbi:hypothetical protein SB48_HM08orf00622 [Heyndrickxia coagulans]|uniref:Uncharacterized protein n=1 Tax=Heyndrickxia coagulans TaxID=1398 RepID=A0AAN0T2M4_HEYCO|nr:hypothetical protein SB48_HM08orf00622 [Heyndrickxia coagulans]